MFRESPLWVDSACADCPGFLVLVFWSCPGFHLRLGALDCSPGLAFRFMGPWTFAWMWCPQLPYRRCKNGTHIGERLRGNRSRGNRPERIWEGNLPLLRGSLRGSFQRFSEVFRGFSEVFQSASQRPSQSAIFLSEFRVLSPLIVLPLKPPTSTAQHRGARAEMLGRPVASNFLVRPAGSPENTWDIGRRRTNVQQLTCNIDLSCSFKNIFFSFVLLELKALVLKGKALGEKFWKSVKNSETILPFSCCPLIFLWIGEDPNINHLDETP